MRHPLRQGPALLATALFVHGGLTAAVYVRHARIDAYAFRSLDSHEYYRLGRNLARHGVYSAAEDQPLGPDYWRTPGYPLVIAACVLILGDSPAGVVLAQQALGALNVVLFFQIAAPLIGPRRAWIAALLFLFEPYRLWYSLWLLGTTFFTTVLLLTWRAWQRWMAARAPGARNADAGSQERPRATAPLGWTLTAGLLAGWLVLIRPVGLFVPLLLCIGLIRHVGRRAAKRAALQVVIFALGPCVVLGSWMMRNYVSAGHFALSSQTGVVLAYFKAAEIVLFSEGRTHDRYVETSLSADRIDDPHPVWDEIDRRLQARLAGLPAAHRETLRWRTLAQGNRSAVDPFVVSSALTGVAWSLVRERPSAAVLCGMTRCVSMLTFPANLAVRPPAGVSVDRVRSAVLGLFYLVLALSAATRMALHALRRSKEPHAASEPAASRPPHPMGAAPSPRAPAPGQRRASRSVRSLLEELYFPLACVVALMLATTPQLDPRFRVPMIPLLLVISLFPSRRGA